MPIGTLLPGADVAAMTEGESGKMADFFSPAPSSPSWLWNSIMVYLQHAPGGKGLQFPGSLAAEGQMPRGVRMDKMPPPFPLLLP